MVTMTKWPVQKHTEHHKTRGIQRRNRHWEITIFVFFGFFWVFFSIFNYLKDFFKKSRITARVRSMKNIVGLNQFYAATNLTHSQHFLEKKKNCPFTLFIKVTKELNKTSGKWINTKSKIKKGWKRNNP